MPRLIRKEEILLFDGISIKDLLKDNFLEKIKEKNLYIDPVAMVLIVFDEKENKLKIQHPIVLAHESKKEVESKIVHITTEKTDASEQFLKVLEELETK